MLLEKIVIEGIMPERALSKLQREGICVYHAKKLKKNQILLSVKKKDTEKVFAISADMWYTKLIKNSFFVRFKQAIIANDENLNFNTTISMEKRRRTISKASLARGNCCPT